MQSLPNENNSLNELQNYILTTLASAEELTTETTNAIYGLSSWYIENGLDEVGQLLDIGPSDALITAHDTLSNEIKKCIDGIDMKINVAKNTFVEIEKRSNLVLDAIYKIRKESLSSEMDYSIEHVRHQFQSTVVPYLTEFLTELNSDSFSLPLSVKKCVESVTTIVPLFLKAEKQISEMESNFKLLWLSFVDEEKKLSTKIHDECTSYIKDGLEKVKELSIQREKYNHIANTIIECRKEANDILEAADTKFTEILEESRRKYDDYFEDIELDGHTLESISDQSDDLIENYNYQLDSTTVSAMKVFLKELKQNSVLVPKSVKKCVKKCVDEAVYLLWRSAVKLEL